MMRTIEIRWIIILVAIGVLPAACLLGGRGTPPTRFHKLESLQNLEPERKALASLPATAVAVGPIELAVYLNRPQIVTVSAEQELRVNEFERWAEPLKASITRVVSDNLALLLNTTRVAAVSAQAFPKADYQVAIDISRFDGTPDGLAVLQARWRILSGGGDLRLSQSTLMKEPAPGAPGNDFSSLVKTQSRLVAGLSREIAQGIAALAKD
jgi:uncharacterized lipoprotein YmbA